MEKWKEIFEKTIPIGKYQVSVKNGDEAGLLIKLESNEYFVDINFGAVSALRMLDEGILLNELYNNQTIAKYKNNGFSNVIYQVLEGEFDTFVRNACNELYDYLKLKHFIIITMNYVTEVISEWEPVIKVTTKKHTA